MVDCIVRVQSRDGISTIPVSSYLHEMVSTLGLYSRVCIHVAKKTEKMYQRALPLLGIVKFGGVAIWRVSCCRRKSLSRILPSLRFTTHLPTPPKETMTTSTPSPTQRRLTPFFTRSIHARSRRVNDSSHAAFQETLDTPIHYIRPTISAKKKNCDGGIPLNIYVQMETMPSLEQSVCSGLEEDMQQMEMTSMPGCCSDEEEDALSHALPMAVIDI